MRYHPLHSEATERASEWLHTILFDLYDAGHDMDSPAVVRILPASEYYWDINRPIFDCGCC